MNSKQLTELSAITESQRINPNCTIFRHIPISGRFRFVTFDENNHGQYRFTLLCTKTSAGWYHGLNGRKFRTSPYSAVLPVE